MKDDLLKNSISAQRLSASEIQHTVTADLVGATNKCSTPFGIRDSTRSDTKLFVIFFQCSTPFGIRDSTLSRDEWIQMKKDVLNAFRHQRFNTRHRLSAMHSFLKVLNAFRHQRFNTSQFERGKYGN